MDGNMTKIFKEPLLILPMEKYLKLCFNIKYVQFRHKKQTLQH